MIGIPYIQSLFTAIFEQSKVISGRFYICPFWGQEINKGSIAEIIEWAVPKETKNQKYPAAILLPIRSKGTYQYSGFDVAGEPYQEREIAMVFCCTPYSTGQNYATTPNPATGKSTHTIPETWHDMERVAVDFMRVLYEVITNPENSLLTTLFISEKGPQEILQVTARGNDEVTGVMLRFTLRMYCGCDIEDYADTYLTDITVPSVTDTHPLHTNL